MTMSRRASQILHMALHKYPSVGDQRFMGSVRPRDDCRMEDAEFSRKDLMSLKFWLVCWAVLRGVWVEGDELHGGLAGR